MGHRQKPGRDPFAPHEEVRARDARAEEGPFDGDGAAEEGWTGGEDQEATGHQVRAQPRDNSDREQGSEARGDCARRRPYCARLLDASPLQEEGCTLLHRQGQEPLGPVGAQEDGVLRGPDLREAGGSERAGDFGQQLQGSVQRQQRAPQEMGWRHYGHQVPARYQASREDLAARAGKEVGPPDLLSLRACESSSSSRLPTPPEYDSGSRQNKRRD